MNSAEYRAARDRLLDKEIELRRAMEAVAAARRALPPGGLTPQDYVFDGVGADGAPAKTRLSELFAPGKDTLIVYNMMFPRHPSDDRPKPATGETAKLAKEETPCPSCTALLDQLDGAVGHLEAAGFNFAVVAQTSIDRLAGFARDRGWKNMRLLSSAGNSFKRDYHAVFEDGSQAPLLSVFHRGARRHPPFLELGDAACAVRSGPGPTRRRHGRAAVEPDGPDARGPAGFRGTGAVRLLPLRTRQGRRVRCRGRCRCGS